MRAFFDSSVLLATFLADHEHHQPSIEAFLLAGPRESSCAAHSLAEVYATATRLPGKHRAGGSQVLLFLESVRERISVVALTPDEYCSALKDAAALDIAGGTVYDALIAACAVKARADCIYSWNVRHFQRLAPEIARRVRTP
ncbi:MAG TPA: PIN domain-containing protein [Verrucomicrobiae bacterium]|nr:PIN domain-containing protein [Verrucomicrobiae bacterium]